MKYSKFNLVFSFNHTYDLVYNSFFGSMLLVDKETGSAIKKGDLTSILSNLDILNQLISANIVLDDSVNEDKMYRINSHEARFSSKAMAIFLGLTSKCNLACKYCYQSYRPTIEGHDLSERDWEIVNRFLRRRVEKSTEQIAIALYGGEPLLNPKVARRIVRDIAKLQVEHGVKADIMLITNGSILNSEVEEVVSSVNMVQVTIDGPREVHDIRRPFKNGNGSFDTIFKNIIKFIDEYRKPLGIRVNVDEYNIESERDLVDYLAMSGLESKIEAIDFSPVMPDQADLYNPLKKSRNYHEYITSISKKIVEVIEYAVMKGFKISRVFLKGPCMCKYLNGYAIDDMLNIYTCPAYMYGEPVGRIVNDKAVILSPERFDPILYDPPCVKDCKYAPMCYGGCVYWRSKNMPTCLRILYGDEHLERLLRAYVISRYREVIKYARANGTS